MIDVSIIGVTGYTGIELLRLLQKHPHIKVKNVFTESYVAQQISEVYPHLKNHVTLMGEKLNIDKIVQSSDLVFISLPHGHSMHIVPALVSAMKKVIDLGSDFRLKNSDHYKQWYGQNAPTENLLAQAVYGLPEKTDHELIQNTNLIANPGCYPTACLLAAYPLLKAKAIEAQECLFDAKSGVSGAGRKPSLKTHFCEAHNNISAYDIAGLHRHTPEIEQELSFIADQDIQVQFTPHIIPVNRGLLATCYFKLSSNVTLDNIRNIYRECYKDEPFIRLCPENQLPQIKHVQGSNYCDIGFQIDNRTKRLIVIVAIDNLIKGAAGQAIQNMNIMYGLSQTTGLLDSSSYP